jgi:hypothetical protein
VRNLDLMTLKSCLTNALRMCVARSVVDVQIEVEYSLSEAGESDRVAASKHTFTVDSLQVKVHCSRLIFPRLMH